MRKYVASSIKYFGKIIRMSKPEYTSKLSVKFNQGLWMWIYGEEDIMKIEIIWLCNNLDESGKYL